MNEKLKQVIQSANSEIMELKFGCKAELGEHKITVLKNVTADAVLVFYNGVVDTMWLDVLKVLGRPIRLADVVLTIQKLIKKEITVAIGREHDTMPLEIYRAVNLWDCTNDNLEHQSDQCKEFLIELLCK